MTANHYIQSTTKSTAKECKSFDEACTNHLALAGKPKAFEGALFAFELDEVIYMYSMVFGKVKFYKA
jgi:hypothetical protein